MSIAVQLSFLGALADKTTRIVEICDNSLLTSKDVYPPHDWIASGLRRNPEIPSPVHIPMWREQVYKPPSTEAVFIGNAIEQQNLQHLVSFLHLGIEAKASDSPRPKSHGFQLHNSFTAAGRAIPNCKRPPNGSIFVDLRNSYLSSRQLTGSPRDPYIVIPLLFVHLHER